MKNIYNESHHNNIQQELENFSWQWNHVQPINYDTPSQQLSTKHQSLARLIEAGALIANQLTILHVKIIWGLEHAVVKLECTQCDEGQPVIMYAGLYPSRPNYCHYFSDKCEKERDFSWIKNEKYQLALEKLTSFDYSTAVRAIFPITEDAATHLLKHMDEIKNNCLSRYEFNKISHNCIDFAQAIYTEAGMSGHYKDSLYEAPTTLQ